VLKGCVFGHTLVKKGQKGGTLKKEKKENKIENNLLLKKVKIG